MACMVPCGEGASCSVAVTAWHVEILPFPGHLWLFVRLGEFSLEFINVHKEEQAARTQVQSTAAPERERGAGFAGGDSVKLDRNRAKIC